jgi:Type IV secretion-system coupling protein DNA-binding domain
VEKHQPDNRLTLLAETNFRNQHRRFGIKRADRRAHMYLIGKTGTGKSTLIANLARQDAVKGEGLALIDPHGDLVEQVLRTVPEERKTDLVYFNVPDTAHPLAFNPLEASQAGFRPLVASGLISVFKKIWAEFWGPRMEYVLRNTLLALLELPGSTLLDALVLGCATRPGAMEVLPVGHAAGDRLRVRFTGLACGDLEVFVRIYLSWAFAQGLPSVQHDSCCCEMLSLQRYHKASRGLMNDTTY